MSSLTDRDRRILDLLVAGKSNKEMEAIFGLSQTTMSSAVNRVYAKIGAATRIEAALWWARQTDAMLVELDEIAATLQRIEARLGELRAERKA